jgi:hypothetical protein
MYPGSRLSLLGLGLCNRHQVILPESLSAETVPDESFQDWEHDDIVESQAQKNPHYNLEILTYLIVHVFPIACLLNHSLLYLNSFSISPDTNAVSESWNKIIKVDEMPENLPERITRFIYDEQESIRGNCHSIIENSFGKHV